MVEDVIFEMIGYFKDDVKRINHALKVFGFSLAIRSAEKLSDIENEIINYTSILHDIGIKETEKKYNSTLGKYQEIEGPSIAKQILEKLNISKDIIDRVCYIIGNHHSYNKIDGLDFQILVESDFIVNIFEDNMDKKSIESIYIKYFKTDNGKKILEKNYLYSTN